MEHVMTSVVIFNKTILSFILAQKNLALILFFLERDIVDC